MAHNCDLDADSINESMAVTDSKPSNLPLIPFLTCINCKDCKESNHLLGSCFHPICSHCVHSILKETDLTSLEMGMEEKISMPEFVCGSCQRVNHYVLYNPFTRMPAGGCTQKCAWCQFNRQEEEASGMCETCNVWLCQQHISVHSAVPAFANHNLMAHQKLPKPQQCTEHRLELDIFCTSCEILTCCRCQLISHSGHKFIPGQERADYIARQLVIEKEKYINLHPKQKSVWKKKMEDTKIELIDNNEKMRDDLLAMVQETVKILRNWHDELLMNIDREFNQRMNLIEQEIKSLETSPQGTDYMSSLVDALTQQCRYHDIIILSPMLMKMLQGVESEKCKPDTWFENVLAVAMERNKEIEPTIRSLANIKCGWVPGLSGGDKLTNGTDGKPMNGLDCKPGHHLEAPMSDMCLNKN